MLVTETSSTSMGPLSTSSTLATSIIDRDRFPEKLPGFAMQQREDQDIGDSEPGTG